MNSLQAKEITRKLMDFHGLDGWRLEFDMSKSNLGTCFPAQKLIKLSLLWVKDKDENQIQLLARHEIAHGLNWIRHGATGHGNTWKKICESIGGDGKQLYCGPPLTHNFELYNKDTGVVYQTYREFPTWGTKVFTSFLPGRPDTKGKLRIRRVDKVGE